MTAHHLVRGADGALARSARRIGRRPACAVIPDMRAITVRDRAAGVDGLSLTEMPYPDAAEINKLTNEYAAEHNVQNEPIA